MIIGKALKNLQPNCQFQVVGENLQWSTEENPGVSLPIPTNIEWYDNSIPFPSREELEAEIARLTEESKNKDYQMRRMAEYPPLSQLADAIYWQTQGDNSKMTEYLAKIEAVKEKYPKG